MRKTLGVLPMSRGFLLCYSRLWRARGEELRQDQRRNAANPIGPLEPSKEGRSHAHEAPVRFLYWILTSRWLQFPAPKKLINLPVRRSAYMALKKRDPL